jgi:hypothetical protein
MGLGDSKSSQGSDCWIEIAQAEPAPELRRQGTGYLGRAGMYAPLP